MVSAHMVRRGIRSRFPPANEETAGEQSIPLLPRPSVHPAMNTLARTLVVPERGGAPHRSG